MARFLKLLILVPLAIIAVAFAFANRQGVTVSFDPFASDVPAFALNGPLFVVLILAVVAGVVIGGVATWLGQAGYRRGLRLAKRENQELRGDVARLKSDLEIAQARVVPLEPAPSFVALLSREAA